MAALVETPMRVTIYVRDRTRHAESTDVKAIWRVVYAAQQLGYHVRLDFYAARELINAGAFDQNWSQLRRDAVAQLESLMAGSGCGISGSDVNHTVVGLVQGRAVTEPVA